MCVISLQSTKREKLDQISWTCSKSRSLAAEIFKKHFPLSQAIHSIVYRKHFIHHDRVAMRDTEQPEQNKPEQNKPWAREFLTEHRHKLQQNLRARLKNEQDAQDLAQEAYLRLLRAAKKGLIEYPQSYLFRIASNLVYELYTKELPPEQKGDESELEHLEDPVLPPEQRLEQQRRLDQVETALKELPLKCRGVITLSCRQGMGNKEIAERLGISTDMVKKYKAKGIAHCRKRLSRFREE
jgi:RNA polymerase sigma-19 factor, ECF subfamily